MANTMLAQVEAGCLVCSHSIIDNVCLRTFCNPLIRLTQNVKSSLDSSSARTQFLGGCRYLLHSLHHKMLTCFCIGAVMSTWDRMQLTHILEGLLIMEVPHRQHSLQVSKQVWCGSRNKQRGGEHRCGEARAYTWPYVCCCCTMLGPEYDTVAGPPIFSVVAMTQENNEANIHQCSAQAVGKVDTD